MSLHNDNALVVALDTSTDMLACAASWIDGQTGETKLVSGDHMCRRHANVELVNTVDGVLAQAGLDRSDVGCYVVGRGPGSFTGVRIGISTAKGLARGANVPLLGVSTLDACAWTAWKAGVRGKLGILADAMRGEVYPALYMLVDEGPERQFEREHVVKAAVALDEWRRAADWDQVQLTGDGLVRYGKLLGEDETARCVERDLWWPSGEGLLLAHAAGDGDPARVLPIYTRLSDAEENERKRLGLAESAQSEITGVADELAGRHLQFRPMGAADAEGASALEAACFEGAGHEAWTPGMFLSELGEDVAAPRSWWVAHDDGKLLGLAGGMVVDGDVQILDVAVDPAHRREGIARKLLSHVSYDAQMLGCTTASLEVEDGNEGAIALYNALGFTEAGRRRGYYGAGKDAIVMTAPLPLVLPVDNASPEPTAAEQRVWPLPAPGRSEGERAEIERRRLVLAIESSCDETAVAIIDADGNMLANQVSTQIDFHARFGGVVPEIASRKHVEVIVSVVDAALEDAAASLGLEDGAIAPSELTAVGVTQGPGLVGALVVGVAFEVLGETLDDAVGEAFDKVAKALGLGYPGGPIISKLAETGNPKAIDFPRALNSRGDYRFSLSGLKTAVTLYIEQETKAGRTIHLPDLAASFEAAVFDVQYKKAKNALHATGCKEYCIGGGVSANPHLREMMIKKLGRQGIRVTVPPLSACTDNAAMIAEVARRKFDRGEISPFDVDADPNMTL